MLYILIPSTMSAQTWRVGNNEDIIRELFPHVIMSPLTKSITITCTYLRFPETKVARALNSNLTRYIYIIQTLDHRLFIYEYYGWQMGRYYQLFSPNSRLGVFSSKYISTLYFSHSKGKSGIVGIYRFLIPWKFNFPSRPGLSSQDKSSRANTNNCTDRRDAEINDD